MEKTAHAKAKPFEIGGGPQEGSHGDAESQGTMAHQHEQHRLQSADRPLAEGTRSSRDEGYLDQTALRGQVTACLRSLMGTAGCNALAAVAARKNPRSLTAWTEARSQTRMSGGVGGVTGAIPSPRPDWP